VILAIVGFFFVVIMVWLIAAAIMAARASISVAKAWARVSRKMAKAWAEDFDRLNAEFDKKD
jgi:hypothetical protein